jgi:hypothetical protein
MPSSSFSVQTFLLGVFALFAGCGDVPLPASKQVAEKPMVKAAPPATKVAKRPPPDRRNPPAPRVGDVDSNVVSIAGPEAQAVKKIGTVIQHSVELGPTLVLWLLDRTPSGRDMVHDVAEAARGFYDLPETKATLASDGKPLLTTIVTFDEQAQFLLEAPTSEFDPIKEAFSGIAPSESSREMPLTALKQALEKYLPLRVNHRRELVVVLVTDEAGYDSQVCDELIETTRRHAIPVYVIGLPAPWGQTNPFAADPKAPEPAADDSFPMFGPESVQSERVDIANWAAHYATSINTDFVDSGFGPFALERLCRVSRGQFLALRPSGGFGYGNVNAREWPSGGELGFDDGIAARYAPDYVSAAEYQQLLMENKARAALCEAAKLPKVAIEGSPGSRFPKGAEAKMANQLSAAQKFAASNSPRVDRLYEVLAPGEADRSKLTSPRWQAEFDLAFGRVLANKARLDGYNSMLAALKRGNTFTKETSTEWILEPADHFETESTIKRMADKARQNLERVIQEHPGTPWAKIAEQELKLPLGWRWSER